MSRSESFDGRPLALPWHPFVRLTAVAAVGITFAVGVGVAQAQVLMAPSRGDLLLLAVYFMVAGVTTVSIGWLLLNTSGRLLPLGIQGRMFLAMFLAVSVALVNILVVAQGMFVSTAHDLKLLTAIVAFSAITTGVFAFLVVRSLAQRITPIRNAIRRLSKGDLAVRLDISGQDEVSELAAELNQLADRLHEADEERNALDRERMELTAAVSHDLRTPLSSLRAMVEALKDGVVQDQDEVERYLLTMGREIDRLGRLIDDLFELARIDAGAIHLERRPVDLAEVAADVADAMRPQALRDDINLTVTVAPRIPVLQVDGARIERAVANLLRNAIEHTPRGGDIHVDVKTSGDEVELSVADSGLGVPEGEIVRVWERFYRGEKSRTRASGPGDGAGLGLAIVRGIVEAHGGSVEAESQPGVGARFVLKLPIGSAG